MDILKLAFIALLTTFSFGEVLRFNIGNDLFIKPVDIVVIFFSIVWISKRFNDFKKIVIKDSLFLTILLFSAALFLSLGLNIKNLSLNEIFVSFSYIARWILYSSLFFAVKSLPLKFKDKALSFLTRVGVFTAICGFIQYLFYPSLRNLYYLGWDEHMYRMFSVFLDPNFAGAFFVCFLIFLGSIFLFFTANKVKNFSKIIAVFLVLTFVSIFLTYSRSALIMLFVAVIIFSLLIKKIHLAIGIILISIVFVLISSRNFNVENVNLFRIASTEARIDSAKIALKIIEKNPIFGVGFDAYRYAQVRYGFRKPDNVITSHADAGTDNSFLFVFATTGIVGLLIYLNLLKSIFLKAYTVFRNSKKNNIEKYLALSILTSLGSLTVDAFFINSLFYSFIMIWIWILLGLMESK